MSIIEKLKNEEEFIKNEIDNVNLKSRKKVAGIIIAALLSIIPLVANMLTLFTIMITAVSCALVVVGMKKDIDTEILKIKLAVVQEILEEDELEDENIDSKCEIIDFKSILNSSPKNEKIEELRKLRELYKDNQLNQYLDEQDYTKNEQYALRLIASRLRVKE